MKTLRFCFVTSLYLFLSLSRAGAQVPTTDIYLMDMKMSKGKYSFTNPQKISDWKGYNNQPYFTPDGKYIYYVSYRGKQSDVYRYEISTKQTTQFTDTPEDEYSPKLTPDGKFISVVRVMKDSAQQLWAFPLDGGNPKLIFNLGADSIGYYCWLGHNVAMANIPVPMKLSVANDQGDKGPIPTPVNIKNVGRTLLVMTDKLHRLLFIQKPNDKKDSIFLINTLDIENGRAKTSNIVQTLPNSEDFALGPKNTLYSGYNGKLYKYQIGKDKDWVEIADFTNTPYKNFYRLVVSEKGDKIAVVSYEGKKP